MRERERERGSGIAIRRVELDPGLGFQATGRFMEWRLDVFQDGEFPSARFKGGHRETDRAILFRCIPDFVEAVVSVCRRFTIVAGKMGVKDRVNERNPEDE